jgi:DNA-binding NarL/FixJ family response regulator
VVLRQIAAEGLTDDEIGSRPSSSREDRPDNVTKACERLRATTRTHAVATAIRQGLIA